MAAVLQSLGKRVRIVNGQATPGHLAFVDPARRIEVLGEGVDAAHLDACDTMIVLDTSAWGQLGPMGDVLRRPRARKLVLDHHVSEDDLGAEAFKEPEVEATGQLVVDAADALGVTIDENMAVPLFMAIATDTGWFRFNSVTSNTYRVAARLIDAGARPEAIYAQLYEQETFARTLLRGRILAGAKSDLDGRLIYSSVVRRDFDETGSVSADTEDVINFLLRVATSEVAIVFLEQSDGKIKASFRSRSAVDVARLAEQFGGGGHRAAAGATIEGPIDAVASRVLDAARKSMR